MNYSLAKRKKSAGARTSGEYRGWWTSIISYFVENHKSGGRNVPKHCHDGTTIFFSSTNWAFFTSLPLSAFSSHSDNIPCSMSGHKVGTHDELCPHNQKTQSVLRSHWTKLAVLFWVWVTFLRPTVTNGLLYQHYSCKPKFHYL